MKCIGNRLVLLILCVAFFLCGCSSAFKEESKYYSGDFWITLRTDGYYRIEDALYRRGNGMPILTGKYSYNCLTGRIVLVDRDNVYQATLKKEKKRLKHLKGDYPSSTVPLDDSDFISYF